MYCSTCGVAVTQGLSFCNFCGAKLSGQDAAQPKIRPESLIFAILAIFAFGMGAISLLMIVLKNALNLHNDEVLLFALFPFLVILVLEFIFVRLLLRNTRAAEGVAKRSFKGHDTKELDAAHARSLPEPVGSVTEATTRAFDPVYTQRNSK
jgi:tryptophan-rich sensory protein